MQPIPPEDWESLSPRRARLRPPRLPGDAIARPRLLSRLNRMAPLSLIVAPAGYGKTTLVGTWLAQTDLPSAWLSLDAEDNEPSSFIAAMTAAIAVIFPGFGEGILERLNSPHSGAFDDLAVLLINALNELTDDFILVLDDYHVIRDPAIHQFLVDLFTYPPRAMHLVLTSRHDPPLPWRIRTRTGLCELRAADLGFTEDEAEQFLAMAAGQGAASADTRTLVQQAHGWVTSLRLTAVAMRVHAEDARWSDMASAGLRSFDDYFSSELLADLAPDTLAFLRRTSILDLLSGPLCDFVASAAPASAFGAVPGDSATGDSMQGGRSAVLLRDFERAGAFTVALDDEGTWYRYHPLFREVLRRQLQQEVSAAEIAGLYTRASTWHEEHNLLDEALAYALSSRDMEYAVDFMQRRRHQLLDNFEWRRLERWLQQFPPAASSAHVELVLTRAWLNQWRYNIPDVRDDLECLNAMLAALPPEAAHIGEWRGEMAALHSQQCVIAGDAAGAVAAAERALASLPRGRFYARVIAMLHLVISCQMDGEYQRARAYLDALAVEDWIPRDLVMARSLMLRAYIDLPATNLTTMRNSAPALLELVTARGQKTTEAWTHYFWASACYLQNDLHAAAEHFHTVLELVDHAHALAYTQSAIGLALTYNAQGLPQEAADVIEGTKRTLTSRQQSYILKLLDAFAAELAARHGLLEEALRWVSREGRQFTYDAFPMLYVTGLAFVRVLLAGGTAENLRHAQAWLQRQLELASRTHNILVQIQCYALAAALCEAQGNRVGAQAALTHALALAENGQVVRIFVDLAAELVPVFDALAANQPLATFAARVHNAMGIEKQAYAARGNAPLPGTTDIAVAVPETGDGSATPGIRHDDGVDNRDLRELLTYREMDVLKLLDQRLTNKEIAHLLGISTETVRQHTVNLFRKLNVDNRRQAVVVARKMRYFDHRD